MSTSSSIWNRKRDIIWLVFFAVHLPVMFLVDLTPLYPTALKPAFLTTIREFYVDTYRDQFFVRPPAWFNAYILMELLYHVPLSTWAIGALIRDDPRLPIHLLIYAVQTAVTTVTCIADYMSWPESEVSDVEKKALAGLYVPYLVVSILMGLDMVTRLTRLVNSRRGEAVGDAVGGKKRV